MDRGDPAEEAARRRAGGTRRPQADPEGAAVARSPAAVPEAGAGRSPAAVPEAAAVRVVVAVGRSPVAVPVAGTRRAEGAEPHREDRAVVVAPHPADRAAAEAARSPAAAPGVAGLRWEDRAVVVAPHRADQAEAAGPRREDRAGVGSPRAVGVVGSHRAGAASRREAAAPPQPARTWGSAPAGAGPVVAAAPWAGLALGVLALEEWERNPGWARFGRRVSCSQL